MSFMGFTGPLLVFSGAMHISPAAGASRYMNKIKGGVA